MHIQFVLVCMCLDSTIKDVTKKYASNWLSTSWKLRDDESWWQKVLLPYQPKLSSKDDKEDQHIEGIQFIAFKFLTGNLSK